MNFEEILTLDDSFMDEENITSIDFRGRYAIEAIMFIIKKADCTFKVIRQPWFSVM